MSNPQPELASPAATAPVGVTATPPETTMPAGTATPAAPGTPATASALRVVAAVVERDGHILACRRRAGKTSAGLWEFPGGKVEPGETAEEALVREIDEELGIHIRVGALVDRSTSALPNGGLIDLACYRATSDELPTGSTDHDRLEWLRPEDLAALAWAGPDGPAVRTLGATRPTEE